MASGVLGSNDLGANTDTHQKPPQFLADTYSVVTVSIP